MSLIERVIKKIGLGQINPELNEYSTEFIKDNGTSAIVDLYQDTGRFRNIREELPNGRYLEDSKIVMVNPAGKGLIIIDEGTHNSDGK